VVLRARKLGFVRLRLRWCAMGNMAFVAEPVHPDTRIGHIHLKVSDLERSVHFYTEALGFELVTRYGDQAAFLSAGGYHHHIGLNTWESLGGLPPPRGTTGLYHFAILLPNRLELARTLRRLLDQGWPIDGASDHGVSEAIYLRDPDDNGIEIYADRPREEWPRRDGDLEMTTGPLNLRRLLADLAAAESKG
jgi:catechol 2,3-dioxygenase